MASLRALENDFPELNLYAISIEGPDLQREMMRKIAADGNGVFPFTLLQDEGARTIDAWGLRDPAYGGGRNDGIPHPAVFVLDSEGRVVWSRIESDYKQRPTLDEIREAIRAAS